MEAENKVYLRQDIRPDDVDNKLIVYWMKNPEDFTATFRLDVKSQIVVDLNIYTEELMSAPRFIAGYLVNQLREFIASARLDAVVEEKILRTVDDELERQGHHGQLKLDADGRLIKG